MMQFYFGCNDLDLQPLNSLVVAKNKKNIDTKASYIRNVGLIPVVVG